MDKHIETADQPQPQSAEDTLEALKADNDTLYQLICDQANEIEQLRARIREAFDVLPDDPFDAYRVLKHSGVITDAASESETAAEVI